MKTLKDLTTYTKEDIGRKDFVGIALQTRTKEASKKGLTCKVDMNPTFIYYQGLRQLAIKYIKELHKVSCEYNFAQVDCIKHVFNITENEIKND